MDAAVDFLKLAKERYSVRTFTKEPVRQEHLDKILQAGHLAPTACNNQPQRIWVINTPEALNKLKDCTNYHFNAPAALLVCYDKRDCWQRRFDGKSSGDIDASIVTTHMMLEAANVGVGTTWVMYFVPDKIKSAFALADDIEPVALLMMGYPAPDAKPAPMHTEYRPMEELVFYA